MKISIELSDAQHGTLLDVAAKLQVAPDQLAAAAVRDLLAHRQADLEVAARRAFARAREIYRQRD